MDESWFVPDPEANPQLKKFAPEEMLTCNVCLRANAPTRAECIYCGAGLAATLGPGTPEETAASSDAQAAQYVVVRYRLDTFDNNVVQELAARFRLKLDELRSALATGEPLPLGSTSSEAAANQVVGELAHTGIESAVITENDVKTATVQVIRALEFSATGLTAISKHGREQLSAAWADLALIVTGRLLVHRVEVDERRSRGAVKPLDRRELSADQSVIDIYAKSSDPPWRIIVNDFDFSCLGERKSLTAFDNVRQLLELLTVRSEAKLNASYARLRPLLANIWPVESTEHQGRSQRPRASRREFSIVTASDNEAQFNRYSQLVWRWERLHSNDERRGNPI
jgi:hypothetical protein